MDLTPVIQISIVPLAVGAYLLYLRGQKAADQTSGGQTKEFVSFQNTFFLPYFMALFSDWLQGPYVYKLYSYYGFPSDQIAILYVVGFASSVTLGTSIGPLADKFGRKRMILVFCVMYTVCCLTKMFPSFIILLFGRVLGGISTSILFSVFESWYLHEHMDRKYPMDLTSLTFSKATFFNGLLAIIAGISAQASTDWLGYGPVSPFMLAIPFLIAGGFLVWNNWEENYGETSMSWSKSCVEGYKTIMSSNKILALGLLQSLFESNMYIFVFLWTPVLEPGSPPLGLTFACFMIAIMIGSSVFCLLWNSGKKPDIILRYCLLIMGISFLICSVTSAPEFRKDLVFVSFLSFLLLEISVGMYFPCVSRVRGETIPEDLRANIMNWFRVPMNIITCGALLGMHASEVENHRSVQIVFLSCTVSSFIGYLVAVYFAKIPRNDNLFKTEKETVTA